jgi:hypothetical protein
MDMAQTFILDAGWVFLIGWGMVLAVISVITFGSDLLRFRRR